MVILPLKKICAPIPDLLAILLGSTEILMPILPLFCKSAGNLKDCAFQEIFLKELVVVQLLAFWRGISDG